MNLLAQPDPTLLPDDPAAAELAAGKDPAAVAAQFPTSSLAWAALATQAREQGATIQAYAFSRVGYHRGLDALRRNGWKGHGPVPWEHEPNRGFLTCLYELSLASSAIGEDDEAERTTVFLRDSSPTAANHFGV